MSPRRSRACTRRAPGYTLIELLVVVSVLGIAAALVVPSMGQTGVLKVQAAVRTVVADLTFAQSDALAYQRRRAMVFDGDTYTLVEIVGPVVDIEADALYDPSGPGDRWVVNLAQGRFGFAKIESVSGPVIDGKASIIFDELGAPVDGPTGDTAAEEGRIVISGFGQAFQIVVEAFTGRIRVERVTPAEPVGG